MSREEIHHLARLVRDTKVELLARWRASLRGLPGAERLDRPTLDDHIPDLIEEIAAALIQGDDQSIVESHVAASPAAHGIQRLRVGFRIAEVVAEYNVLRQCLHDLADEHDLTLRGESFHIVNRVLDDGITVAVQSYATERALELQQRREEHLAFIAHDLRTPLQAIALAAMLIEAEIDPDRPGAADALRTMHRNIGRLDALVHQVVQEQQALSQQQEGRLERRELDLWPLVEGLIRDLRPLSEASRTRVRNDVPRDLAVFADAQRLARVLQNLLANAIAYTPDGDVTVVARSLTDGSVECEVVDSGAGVPPSLLPHVFEKLATDPEKASGTGLGLAIVKEQVELHGGTVRVESQVGVGTTFGIRLPARGATLDPAACA